METTGSVPEKVAWVLVRDGRVLVTRDEDRDLFYLPGGMREPGESDSETLVREIEEELQAVIVAGTLVHFGTFETRSDHGGRVEFRMICYAAVHRGALNPAGEIAELAWFGYGQRDRVSPVDRMVFDALHMDGQLP